MADICMHAVVSGRVQGVWFRRATQEEAKRSHLTGWVRNLSNGDVEVLAVGEEHAVRQLEAWLSQGPELASVAEVKADFPAVESLDEVFSSFDIR